LIHFENARGYRPGQEFDELKALGKGSQDGIFNDSKTSICRILSLEYQ